MKRMYLLIMFLVAILAVFGYLQYNNTNNHPILPNTKLCHEVENGWNCVLEPDNLRTKLINRYGWFERDWSYYQKLDTQFAQKCNEQEGKWRCEGKCLPFYTHECLYRLEDAGTPCTDSTQCSDKCVITRYKLEEIMPTIHEKESENYSYTFECEECEGTCSEYPISFCDRWYEVNTTTIIDNSDIICD